MSNEQIPPPAPRPERGDIDNQSSENQFDEQKYVRMLMDLKNDNESHFVFFFGQLAAGKSAIIGSLLTFLAEDTTLVIWLY